MKHAAASITQETAAPVEAIDGAADLAATTALDSILADPYTWTITAFVIFIALFARYVAPKIGKALDDRSDKIRDQLEQASRLRAEAEALLASYQREQKKLLEEATAIIATAQKDAAELRVRAAEELKLALDRRTQQAKEKIARAEAEAVAQIRTRIIETATDTARDMLAERTQHASEERAIAQAIEAIGQKIH